MKNVGQVIDIDSTCCNVRCHQNLEVPILETVHDPVSLGLRHFAMKCIGSKSKFQKVFGQGLRVSSRSAKNDTVQVRFKFQKARHCFGLVGLLHHRIFVLDVGVDGSFGVNTHLKRGLHILLHHSTDFPWHRCREEPRLFGVRCKLEDGIQFVLESHIEHLIRLVQNEVLDLVQFQGLALHQINQTAGSGDDDVARSLELRYLRRDIRAAINGHTFDAFEVLGVPAGSSLDVVKSAHENAVASLDEDAKELMNKALNAVLKKDG